MTDHAQKAKALFLSGYNCAQSLLAAFCDLTGLTEEQAMKMASSMGGGMGRLREVCGGCTSAFLVLGLLYGYEGTGADGGKAAHYALIQDFAHRFEAAHGSYLCRDLLAGMHIPPSTDPVPEERTPEYYQHRYCARYIEWAARTLDSLIAEKGQPEGRA